MKTTSELREDLRRTERLFGADLEPEVLARLQAAAWTLRWCLDFEPQSVAEGTRAGAVAPIDVIRYRQWGHRQEEGALPSLGFMLREFRREQKKRVRNVERDPACT